VEPNFFPARDHSVTALPDCGCNVFTQMKFFFAEANEVNEDSRDAGFPVALVGSCHLLRKPSLFVSFREPCSGFRG
jgi:hypothetical protein